MFCFPLADKEGDELRGAVPHYDVFRLRSGVCADGFSKVRVFAVGVGGYDVQVRCQVCFHRLG